MNAEAGAVAQPKESASNIAWQRRKDRAFARGEANLAPVFVERARNSEVWDVEGNRYVDFGSGIAVCNTGHSHPKIVDAVKAQLDRFSHTCVMVSPYDCAVELAERLNASAPGDTPKKTMLVTTGAEAVENAVKIARAHTRRRAVVAFNGGFHGRTNFTLGLTGKHTPYKTGFGPFPGEIYRAPFPIAYHGVSVCDSMRALEDIFICDCPPNDIAAFIIEPVLGEGGFYPAPDEFLQSLRRICDQHGIVLIADEIQTGFARTGRFFAIEYSGVEPDLMAVAKGMAGGFPLAGVIGKAEIMDAPAPGGLGGTYAGSPIGCSAALAALNIIEEEHLTDAALRIGDFFRRRLASLRDKYPSRIGEIRADRGAMAALEFVHDGDSNRPDAQTPKALVAEAARQGLILLSCGIRGNVIRLLPPLTISEALLDEGFDVFEGCLKRQVG